MAGLTIKQALEKVKSNKGLMQKIESVLDDEVAGIVKNAEAVSAMTNFYDQYKPTIYKRRYSLANPDNMPHEVKDKVLTVYTRAKPYPWITDKTKYGEIITYQSSTPLNSSIAKLTEYSICDTEGYGYDFVDEYRVNWMQHRPYIQPAIDYLKRDKDHIIAMRSGLKRRGVKVE